jgi:ankyrin repeat protein
MQARCGGIDNVNRAADSGNTPLHVAVNLGDMTLVDMLTSTPGIDVNAVNQQADGATPLHLSVMHGLLNCRLYLD